MERTAASLEKLSLPAAETIARFDRNLSDAQAAIARFQGQLEEARGNMADIAQELERLRLEGEVPSEAELADARSSVMSAGGSCGKTGGRKRPTRRPWKNSSLMYPAHVPVAGTRSVPDTLDLAAAYEQTVRRADDLSDRLRREANRVANRATLQARQLSLQQQTVELGRQHATALEQFAQMEAQWRQAWQPAGIEPLPPREMQAWDQRQQGLVRQAQMVRQRTAVREQLEEQIAAHCRQVQSCLDALLPSPGERGRG